MAQLVHLLSGRTYSGTVTKFDDGAGIGAVTLDDATELGFHCTQIADGSRTIASGTPITCSLLFVNLGVLEAANIKVRSTSITTKS